MPPEYRDNAFWGSVKATGRILLGTRGFRAQKIEIEALCASQSYRLHRSGILEKIGNHYNVPVFHDLDALLAEFPPSGFEGFLPAIPQEQWDKVLRFQGISHIWYTVRKDPYESGGVLLGDDGSNLALPPDQEVVVVGSAGNIYRLLPDGRVIVSFASLSNLLGKRDFYEDSYGR